MTEKMPKNANDFYCEFCDFKCSKYSNFNNHLMTLKHKRMTNDDEKMPKNANAELVYDCECGKSYKYRQGLFAHKKKCMFDKSPEKKVDISVDTPELISKLLIQNQELLLSNQYFKELMIEQTKQINEQQDENKLLQKQLIEAVKENSGTINNTINNNQKFNLNFFLNTTCKDAMNMSEFIENIEVNFKDIENIGKNGYVSGMTDMILSRIKELDVTKRPMHCTDLKRETMYIKDNDEWAKDTPENSKFHKMIDYVAKQNYAKMPLWRQRNPECLDSDHPKYDFCIKMMRNMLGDVGAEQVRLDNKVIKNLSKHIFVDKAVN